MTAPLRSMLAGLLLLAAAPALAQAPQPTVTVATPLAKRVTQWDEYTGRFEAAEIVEVRARVSGFLDKVHFRDGQTVKQGDLLFTLDQRPFRLSVEAATAEIERAKAQVRLAETEVERAEALTQNRVITQRDVDQRRANLRVAQAGLQAAEAAASIAQLNLDWTEVRAPISGRVSDRKIDPGNLIAGGQAGATVLTTIVTTSPIHFVFNASEADYLRYARLANNGSRASSREAATPVEVRLADENSYRHKGQMNFVDNRLNERSGTIRGRAIFANEDGFLTPGVFGRLRLSGGEIDALMIPDASIVADQTRKVVMTVNAEGTVVPKPVELGPIVEGLRVVREGLAPDDRVIIAGLANPMVRPGVKVATQPGTITTAAR